MSISKPLQSLIDALLSEVQTDSQHRMSPYRRRELYNAFYSAAAAGQQGICWLAIITAKRALPMFQARYPDDTLPPELLEAAIDLLQGRVSREQIEDILDLGCHASTAAWGHDEREIPWSVWQAGNASYYALNVVCGGQPLRAVDHDYYKNDVLTPWTDEELCEFFWPDPAAAAAIASSSDRYGRQFDSGKLLEFWTWWLVEAIPKAVEITQSE